MTRKRSQLQAYFAGIMDGEGHFTIFFNGSTYGSRLYVQMDDPQAVMLMAREYPEALIQYRFRGPERIPYYAVAWNHYNGIRLLDDILPFLLVKHEQAKVVKSFLVHRRTNHSLATRFERPKGQCERCQHLHDAIHAIRAKDKGMNSVNALLQQEMREYRAKPEEVVADVQWMTSRLQELQDSVETRLSESNKTISVPEKDIVQHAA